MVWFDHLDGIKITEENIGLIASKTKASVISIVDKDDNTSKHILISTNRGDLLVNVGDWISYDRFGRLRIMRIHDLDTEKLLPITNKDDMATKKAVK